MDTQNLAAFEAVARWQSFSEAAEHLHLTQPAVSKRIATLEEQLSTKLFDRLGRSIALTEAGRALLPRARQILNQVEEARGAIADLSGDVKGRLRVATSHHIGLHRLPPVLRQFNQQHPEVTLDIAFLGSEKAYAAVEKGEYELAVTTLASNNHPKVHSLHLWNDPLQFVAAPDHPLSRRDRVTLQDIVCYPAILPEVDTYTTAIINTLFDQQGLSITIGMATNYLETNKMMVAIGLGWSVLPHTMIDKQLKILHLENSTDSQQLSRQLGCIYHRGRSLSNAACAFVDTLAKTKNENS